MTRLQHLLYVLGFWRFKLYRRWVGGRWAEQWPVIGGGRFRWKLDANASFNDYTQAIEQWPIKLPKAHVRRRK